MMYLAADFPFKYSSANLPVLITDDCPDNFGIFSTLINYLILINAVHLFVYLLAIVRWE
jgi:hypothetical protein